MRRKHPSLIVKLIGIDLVKPALRPSEAWLGGSIAFRKTLSRGQLLACVARHPKYVFAMEAWAVTQSAVRPDRIVGAVPLLDQDLGLSQASEDFTVGQLVSEPGVEVN